LWLNNTGKQNSSIELTFSTKLHHTDMHYNANYH
jgi:hypothetical protein